jgi:hypothetical protein
LGSRLPEVARTRRQTYLDRRSEVESEVERIHTRFAVVARHHAPSSWTEISGAGAEAEQSLIKAGQRYQQAVERDFASQTPKELEMAVRNLDEALAALNEALAQATKIEDRMAMVEEAAANARDLLNNAEAAIDRAWALSGGRSGNAVEVREALERATKLIEQGRAEMTSPQPDWLMIVNLAKRAQSLAELTAGEAGRVDAHASVLYQLLEVERERAKATRDQAWATALGSAAVSNNRSLNALLEGLESTYQTALRLEAEASSDRASVVNAEAADAAIHAFRSVVGMAGEFMDQAERLLTPRHRYNRRNDVELAELVVWGVAGIAAALLDNNRK